MKIKMPWQKDDPAYELFGTKPRPEEVELQKKITDVIKKVLIGGVALTVVLILVFNYQAFVNLFLLTFTPRSPEITEVEEIVVEPEPTIITGSLIPLLDDLGYLNSYLFSEIKYYQAGIYHSGQYQGARRIVVTAKRTPTSATEIFIFLAATDGRVFFDGGSPSFGRLIQSLDSYYLMSEIMSDEHNIVWTDRIENDHPQTLAITPSYYLNRRDPLSLDGPYVGAPPVLETGLVINYDLEEYTQLDNLIAEQYPNLSFYMKNYDDDELLSQIANDANQEITDVLEGYLEGGSKIIVVDQTGLAYTYDLTFRNKIEDFSYSLDRAMITANSYKQSLIQYSSTAEFISYKRDLQLYLSIMQSGGEMPLELSAFNPQVFPGNVPALPVLLTGYPGLNFERDEFLFRGEAPFYENFGPAYESTCSGLVDAKVLQNVNDENFELVGTISIPQTPLYKVATNDVLLNLAYEMKVGRSSMSTQELIAYNFADYVVLNEYDRTILNRIERGRAEFALPSKEKYVVTMPMLFFQDPWQRWLAIWENDLFFSTCD